MDLLDFSGTSSLALSRQASCRSMLLLALCRILGRSVTIPYLRHSILPILLGLPCIWLHRPWTLLIKMLLLRLQRQLSILGIMPASRMQSSRMSRLLPAMIWIMIRNALYLFAESLSSLAFLYTFHLISSSLLKSMSLPSFPMESRFSSSL